MAKRDMKAAFSKSLQTEQRTTADRFAKADMVFNQAPRKPKTRIVRDTFSMPEPDHALIGELIDRAKATGTTATKSELVRAGLKALADMKPAELAAALSAVEKIKKGPSH